MKFSFTQFLNEGLDNLIKKDKDESDDKTKDKDSDKDKKSDSDDDKSKDKSAEGDEKDTVLGDDGKGESKGKKSDSDDDNEDDPDEKSEGKTFGVAYFNPATSRRGELTVKAKDQADALATAKAEIKEGVNFKVREIKEAAKVVRTPRPDSDVLSGGTHKIQMFDDKNEYRHTKGHYESKKGETVGDFKKRHMSKEGHQPDQMKHFHVYDSE